MHQLCTRIYRFQMKQLQNLPESAYAHASTHPWHHVHQKCVCDRGSAVNAFWVYLEPKERVWCTAANVVLTQKGDNSVSQNPLGCK